MFRKTCSNLKILIIVMMIYMVFAQYISRSGRAAPEVHLGDFTSTSTSTNCSNTNQDCWSFQITVASSLASYFPYQTILGFNDMTYDVSNMHISCEVLLLSTTATMLKVHVIGHNKNQLTRFSIGYMLISSKFPFTTYIDVIDPLASISLDNTNKADSRLISYNHNFTSTAVSSSLRFSYFLTYIQCMFTNINILLTSVKKFDYRLSVSVSLTDINITHTLPSPYYYLGIQKQKILILIIDINEFQDYNLIHNTIKYSFNHPQYAPNSYINQSMSSTNYVCGIFSFSNYYSNTLGVTSGAQIYAVNVSRFSKYLQVIHSYDSLTGYSCVGLFITPCTKSYPKQLLLLNRCFITCPFGYYQTINQACLSCSETCKTCFEIATNCTSCYQTQNRVLLNNACVPFDSYYQTNLPIAFPCMLPCRNCIGPSVCTSCISPNHVDINCAPLDGYYYDQKDIRPCSFPCLTCINHKSTCQSCPTTHYLTTSNQCYLCSDIIMSCINCQNTNNICVQCENNYELFSNQCFKNQCGNNIRTSTEQCDDGNFLNGDGCSSACLAQENFHCEPYINPTISTHCWADLIHFKPTYIEKVRNQNMLVIQIQLTPQSQKLWQNINFSEALSLTVQAKQLNFNWRFNSPNILYIELSYIKDIQGKEIQLKLSGHPTVPLQFRSLVPMAINTHLEPFNNQIASYSSQQTNQISRLITILCKLVLALLALTFVLMNIRGKPIFIQTVYTIQLTYFSLIGLEWMPPTLANLDGLSLANGFNYNKVVNPYKMVEVDRNVRGIKLVLNYFQNSSFSLISISFILILSILFFIYGKGCSKMKYVNYSKICLFEYILTYLMFSLLINLISFGLNLKFGCSNFSFSVFANLFIGGLVVGITFVYFTLFIKDKKNFQEFASYFKPIGFNYYYMLVFVGKIFSAIALVVFKGTVANLIILSIGLVLLVFALFCKPYVDKLNLINFLLNTAVGVLVQIVILICNMRIKNGQILPQTLLYSPLFILTLFFCLVTFGLILVVKSIIEFYSQNKYSIDRNKQAFENVEAQRAAEIQYSFLLLSSGLDEAGLTNIKPINKQQAWDNLDNVKRKESLHSNDQKQHKMSEQADNELKYQKKNNYNLNPLSLSILQKTELKFSEQNSIRIKTLNKIYQQYDGYKNKISAQLKLQDQPYLRQKKMQNDSSQPLSQNNTSSFAKIKGYHLQMKSKFQLD